MVSSVKKSCNFFITFLKNIIAPPFCLYCKDYLSKRTILCKRCYNAVYPIVTHTIQVTKKYQVKVFAISDYKDPIRSLILSKGSSDIVAIRNLGDLIWELTYLKNAQFDYIVPIPLHWQRYAQRGFNQADEIAHVISKKSGKPVVNLLRRRKRTKRQSGLEPSQRIVNLSGAFELKGADHITYKDKNILIVDDLLTTGSTIRFACKQLIALKPKSIIVAVACRVL